MTLWIGNGAVLKSSSQWQLKELRKLNNSGHELSIFKILILGLKLFREIYLLIGQCISKNVKFVTG